MKYPTVVFDTSVLLSAIGWGGKPAYCLDFARNGRVEWITCKEILEELAAKLEQKLFLTEDEVAQILLDLLGVLSLVKITGTLHAVPADPKDDMIIECAVVANADYIVSGDRRHLLPIGSYRQIRIVNPATLLSELTATE